MQFRETQIRTSGAALPFFVPVFVFFVPVFFFFVPFFSHLLLFSPLDPLLLGNFKRYICICNVFNRLNMETLVVDPWITILDLEVEPADAYFILSPAMCRVVAMDT
jgi:hypothetical protein